MGKSSFNSRAALQDAKRLHTAGNMEDAKAVCSRILQHYPLHQEALYFLARLCADMGFWDEALLYIQKAFLVNSTMPGERSGYFAILNHYLADKQYPKLEQASRWLTSHLSKDGIAWDYLTVSLLEQGRYFDALEAAQKAVKFLPTNVHIQNNLAYALIGLERCTEAAAILRVVVQTEPTMASAHNNLGNALRYNGDYEGAMKCFEAAIAIAPETAYFYNNLGLTYRSLDRYQSSIDSYQKALQIQPDLVQVYPNLIDVYRQAGMVQQAIECGQHALTLTQELAEIWGAFGDALRDAGQLDAAIESYVKAVSFKTDSESSFNRKIYTNILFCLNYHPDLDAETIFSAYREFDQRFALSLKKHWRPFNTPRDTQKKLKVGYLSQSFYNQVCKFFLIPLLEKHDRSQFEIYAYAQIPYEDETTAHYKTLVDHWVPIRELMDDQVAERIRADEIDILVDVSGHTNSNRLLVFAQKPAPVSLHWLEYGYTTGLSAIDYFMTDRASVTDDCGHLFSEQIWILDSPAYVYRPDTRLAILNDSPAVRNGYVTFGSLSRTTRINHRVVRIWAAILDAVPDSHLIINSGDFKDPRVQDEMAARFMQYGIARSRLEISFSSPSWDVLKHVDIGLDCFPHNSGTTLLETLFMGIPFVTLLGRPSVGRIGASVLSGMGRTEWIASSEEEYAQKAVILAHDLEGLQHMRQFMRAEMQASALMDEPAFAQAVERAYRQMWTRYCERNGA